MEWIDKDPFQNFKLKLDKSERDYLTERELDLIEETTFTQTGHEWVKDIFLFSCYTGLSYIDLKELRADQVVLGIDGNHWIHTKRVKMNEAVKIPQLSKALEIIEKYNDEIGKGSTFKLLPVYSNQKTNKYLKTIAIDCGIQKKIKFYVARHTFATTVTLSHGVPIETVSKLLGHTQLRTPQIYARVIEQKASEYMQLLLNKLNAKDNAESRVH
jgi:integrase